jgi:predicted transcriptional regulator
LDEIVFKRSEVCRVNIILWLYAIMKLKNENELLKKALQVGAVYAEKRGYGEIEDHDSAKLKVEFLYRVLVEDKLIHPLAKNKISDPNMRHKLALWVLKQLPEGHVLKS